MVKCSLPRLAAWVQSSEHQQLRWSVQQTRRNHDGEKYSQNMKTKYIIPGQKQMSASTTEFEKSPNTDRQSKAHLSLSISTALGCVYGIVIICTDSKPTQLHDVSHHDSLDTRRLDKPDWITSMRRNGVDKNHASSMLLVGIWYWPMPSTTTTVTGGVTIHNRYVKFLVCHLKVKWCHILKPSKFER